MAHTPNYPIRAAAAVVANDGADLTTTPTRGLYIGVTGDVKVNMADGATVVLKAMPVGLYSLSVARVWATGTTATNIIALY